MRFAQGAVPVIALPEVLATMVGKPMLPLRKLVSWWDAAEHCRAVERTLFREAGMPVSGEVLTKVGTASEGSRAETRFLMLCEHLDAAMPAVTFPETFHLCATIHLSLASFHPFQCKGPNLALVTGSI